ncbi:MAG: HIT domain-containing protein [bacterium]
MVDCIFCKILKDEIPSYKVYEDNYTVAFLDIAPVNPGHILVIPKDHIEKFEDLDEVLLDAIMNTVQKVAKTLKTAVGVDGYNLIVNNGPDAGQIIDHFHIHIIPRKKDDGLAPLPQSKYDDGEAKKVMEKIKSALK